MPKKEVFSIDLFPNKDRWLFLHTPLIKWMPYPNFWLHHSRKKSKLLLKIAYLYIFGHSVILQADKILRCQKVNILNSGKNVPVSFQLFDFSLFFCPEFLWTIMG